VRIHPDGKKVVSGSMDRTIRVWDAATGKELVKMFGHQKVVSELAVAADGKLIASAGHDGTVRSGTSRPA
jgi:WD40 repeat protein